MRLMLECELPLCQYLNLSLSYITYAIFEADFVKYDVCGCHRWKPSRDYNSSTRDT